MTEPTEDELIFCVRDCALPCGCSACDLVPVPIHPPAPSLAVDGLLCLPCRGRLWDMLCEIPELGAELSIDLVVRGDSPGGGGSVKGSPALIRLDVLALIDGRTMASPDLSEPLEVSAVMAGWAANLRDALDNEGLPPEQHLNMGDRGRPWLLTHAFEDLVWMDWIAECYREIAHVHQLLLRAVGMPGPRPIGNCITTWVDPETGLRSEPCGADVFVQRGQSKAMCGRCGTRYEGMELVRMELEQGSGEE